MTSKVELCSNALLLLGHSPISSMGEGDRGVLMQSLYDQVRRATIRAHVWNFAKWAVDLAPDSTPPAGEWSSRFLFPGDLLRFLWIGERGETYEYDIQGRSVLFDDDGLYLTYLRDVEDPNEFDALFADALCANLAFTGAYPLTKSIDLQKAMYALYTQKLKDATQINGQEIPPAEISGSPLLSARRRRS
jgi:hypothetical protein